MSNVRVTYSGLIAFVVGLASLFTGLVFTLIVTRRLAPEEFGTWSLIGTIIFYLIVSETIISYWTTRQVARGEEVGKTSVMSSGIFTLGVIPIYLGLAYLLGTQSNADFDALMFGVILLPVYYISQTIGGINISHKPQAVSYGFLVFETAKIPTALAFVYFLDMGIEGAIISVTLAYIMRIVLQIKFASSKLKNKFNFQVLKRWIRLSWVSVYSSLTKVVVLLDVMFYPLITGSVLGVAYYSAALTIAALVAHSSSISQALAPKLLAKGSPDHIPKNLSLMMYFAIPLLAISVIFSKVGLFALNPAYESAYVIAILLSFKIFFFTLNITFRGILESIETVDIEEKPKFSKLIKSKLFQIPTWRYVNSFLYLTTFIVLMIFLYGTEIEELELVKWWAALSLGFEIPFFIFMAILLYKNTKFTLPYSSILKYIGAAFLFGIIFIFTSDYVINHQISIYEYLPSLLAQLLICIIVYLSVTYLIDKRTRNLFTIIFNELRSRSDK